MQPVRMDNGQRNWVVVRKWNRRYFLNSLWYHINPSLPHFNYYYLSYIVFHLFIPVFPSFCFLFNITFTSKYNIFYHISYLTINYQFFHFILSLILIISISLFFFFALITRNFNELIDQFDFWSIDQWYHFVIECQMNSICCYILMK